MLSMAFYSIYHLLHYKLSVMSFYYIQGLRRTSMLCSGMFSFRLFQDAHGEGR
jgi:hypothetical protein